MAVVQWVETYGAWHALAAGGAVIGLGFGFLAQRSRFCLRAAEIEFWHRRFGGKFSIWLLTFAAAVIPVQLLVLGGWLESNGARQIAARGSLSGALLGGLAWLAVALLFIWRSPVRTFWMWVGGIGTGLMEAAWVFSHWMARESFDPIQIEGLTFG